MSTFMFDRLDSLLKSNGMTRKALCQLSGHADNYIRMFEKRGKEPPRDFVLLCAQQLGTTSAYLYGETDSPEKEKAPAATCREVTDEDIKFALFGRRDISDSLFSEVKTFAQYAMERRKNGQNE